MEIFKLFGSIMVDSDGAEKSISKTGKEAEGLGSKLGNGIKTAAKFGAALVAGATAAIGGMVALGLRVGNMADEILDLNSITGMSTEEIQKWRKVAEVAGVGANSMTNASQKLTRSLDMMSEGTGKGAESLAKLGFSFQEIEAMSADERMNVLTEALAGVEDETERARIGTDLFGGSWKEIAPIVAMGADEMKKAKDSANIISEDDLIKANNFRIAVADMKDQMGFFVTQLGIAVLPILEVLFNWFGSKMPMIKTFSENAINGVITVASNLGDYFTGNLLPKLNALWEWVQPYLPLIKDFFFDTFRSTMDLLSEFGSWLYDKAISRLQELWDWISPHMPMIKDAFATAFQAMQDAVSDTINFIRDLTGWFEDHWSIVEPILIGIAAGAAVFQVITTAMALYRGTMILATAAQIAFNTALTINPIGLIVVAIGLLVAAGVYLWQNWDVVKTKLNELWSAMTGKFTDIKNKVVARVTELAVSAVAKFEELKSKATAKVVELATGVVSRFLELKNNASKKVNELKTAIVNKFQEAKTGASNKVNELKNDAVAKFSSILTSAREKFNAVKSAIMTPINNARDAVGRAVEKIKGFFTGMKLSLPKIKVPSFSLKNWSNNPIDWIGNMPKIAINWNAKGALFTKPTVFNTPMGLQGFGEAGPEAALPLTESVLGMIGRKIADTMEPKEVPEDSDIIIHNTIVLDGKVIEESVTKRQKRKTGRRTPRDKSIL
ncbi:hypothetical protein [Jeotgalibacillus proteolyticus]|uniref:Phage tail tape measure protein n=1 Tax=Jeotgalibacillus proteolyticus TaxID=2082395 RepID=A0A2S5GG52_9BACL|nr:hypothetical protein [Jeotgalibacillus proteolyticus]PPA71904.1 hypothetical protein C4B60_00565 [Jeotgalibacillus proteolyticus]